MENLTENYKIYGSTVEKIEVNNIEYGAQCGKHNSVLFKIIMYK